MNTIHNNSRREKRSKKEKKSYDNHIMLWVTFLNDLTGTMHWIIKNVAEKICWIKDKEYYLSVKKY